MPEPSDSGAPQLYQVIGAVLRDVAQARFMSDLYSRQISYTYEGDALLRRFPVPRIEIEQVEFELKLAVSEVREDGQRKASRNAAIGRLLDSQSAGISRLLVAHIQRSLRAKATDDDRKKTVDAFEKRFLSDDRLEVLHGRVLRYFNENIEDLVTNGVFNDGMALEHIHREFVAFGKEPDVEPIVTALQLDWVEQWNELNDASLDGGEAGSANKETIKGRLKKLAEDIGSAWNRYPDFSVHVEVSAGVLKDLKDPLISALKVTAAVKNYRWAKVDVDPKDLRNIRTLNPE